VEGAPRETSDTPASAINGGGKMIIGDVLVMCVSVLAVFISRHPASEESIERNEQ
jgi:hypothetical protein